MSTNPNLSHAARLAQDAERILISAFIHLEEAGYEPTQSMTYALVVLRDVGTDIQQLADWHGHAEVRRWAG